MARRTLRLAHLYPSLMNIYGDRGNVLCWRRRCQARGIELQVDAVSLGDRLDPGAYDLLFIGGGQDREQRRIARDLVEDKGEALHQAIEEGVVTLAVCGGYQLFGRYYRTADGEELPGLAIFDAWTEHPGAGAARCIGDVVVLWQKDAGVEEIVVGFENHGGRTYLGPSARPLARVVAGHGNNGRDGGEGAVCRNAFGTYLHGSLLPKNPRLADHLLALALARRYGPDAAFLPPLDDSVEEQAHAAAIRVAKARSKKLTGGRYKWRR